LRDVILIVFLGGNNGTICGPKEEDCLSKANGKLSFEKDSHFSFYIFLEIILEKGYELACPKLKCYEACNYISYDKEISNAPLEDENVSKDIKFRYNIT
jgi:hypothetical protein